MRHILLATVFALTTIGFGAAVTTGCGSDEPDVLECDGDCGCDEETRTCNCSGGTDCVIEGAEDLTFECDGNADCDLTCGTDCHVICPGTTTCTATLTGYASAECQGTGTCEYYCDTDCDIDCGSNTDCTVNCHDDCDELDDNDGCRC